MMIKRLDISELREECKKVFYDYLLNGKEFCIGTSIKPISGNMTPVDCLYGMNLKKYWDNEDRIEMINDILSSIPKGVTFCDLVYKEMIEALKDEQKLLEETSMATQKARYKKSKVLDYARSAVRIPLNKKINSFYDDFLLEVLFYDDVTTLGGRYKEYIELPVNEKETFLKKNTVITHMGLHLNKDIAYEDNAGHVNVGTFTIRLLGDSKKKVIYPNYLEHYTSASMMLNSKFADFANLTLADTMSIKNNDLRQMLQDKIDLDKMCLEIVTEKVIGNDKYTILTFTPEGSCTKHYFIRYKCPSTGRIYFNELNFENLKISKYYYPKISSSWIDAWWSIAHMGANPEGKAMIRC